MFDNISMLERSRRDTASFSLTDGEREDGNLRLVTPESAVQQLSRSERGAKRTAIQVVSSGGFYGAERALIELAAYLQAQGWESHVLALEGQGAPEIVRRARDCGLNASAFSDGGRLPIWTLRRKLKQTLDRHSRAIIHAHGYKADILLASVGAVRRLGCIATCHTWYSDTLKMRLFERLDKRILRGFDHIVAVSEEIRAELLDSGMSPSKVSKIDNGISVPARDEDSRASVRREFGIGPDELLVVQIGRLAKSKRNDLLLEAAARLSTRMPLRVLMVGEGDEREAILDKTRSLGLSSRVILCGYRTDAHRIIAAANVLALTSNKEGLPIVILEAMALGCPIVSTAVGAVPSVLRSDETAWLVPVEDVDALARALEEALGKPTIARARADGAKTDFCMQFDRDVMGRRYLDLYERVWAARVQ